MSGEDAEGRKGAESRLTAETLRALEER